MNTQLPTFTSAQWTVTTLLDSIRNELVSDTECVIFRMFAYAVTTTGWQELRPSVIQWLNQQRGRAAVVYVGTDHALTEPDALRSMRSDGVEVRLMRKYHGIYHPKLFWMLGDLIHRVWVGSNNITRDGLLNNVEFATLIKTEQSSPDLVRWFQEVDKASELFNERLINSYETERRAYAQKRVTVGTFTWTLRQEPPASPLSPTPNSRSGTPQETGPLPRRDHLGAQTGDLVVEIMPRETGPDGKQIQLPKWAAVHFFGLQSEVGASRQLTLSLIGSTEPRSLTMTLFGNNTARLSITELDYRDRPCAIIFHRQSQDSFLFEIVQQSIFPTRYRNLLSLCGNQTRTGSRRWGILSI